MSSVRICATSAVCEARDWCSHARPHIEDHLYDDCNAHPCKVRCEMVNCLDVDKAAHLITPDMQKSIDNLRRS